MHCRYPSLFNQDKYIDVWYCVDSCCKGTKLHRGDGPAYIGADGTEQWWIHGKQVSEADVAVLQASLGQQMEERKRQEIENMISEMRKGIRDDIPYSPPLQFRKGPSGLEKKDGNG